MRLIITHHARQQMFERGIDEEQVKITIQRGAKIRQTSGFIALFTYVRVVYRPLGDGTYKIITVMVE